jgi:hypothetical protein
MITHNNFKEVVSALSAKDIKRIKGNHWYEYTVLYLSVFNTGFCVNIRLTNDYNRYKNVSNNGDAILETDEVIKVLEELGK